MSHDKTRFKTKITQIGTQTYEATVDVVDVETDRVVSSHTAEGPSAKKAAQEAVSKAVASRPIDRGTSTPEDPFGPGEVHTPLGDIEIESVETQKPPQLSEKKNTGGSKTPHLGGAHGKKQIKASAGRQIEPQEEPEDPPVYLVKGNPRNHSPWQTFFEDDQGNVVPMNDGRPKDGIGYPLNEPVPEFFKRSGDKVITAEVNNNAWIVLGRDRNGIGESWSSGKINDLGEGSFGDHMGAGAIDIVVGRGAPFPLKDGIGVVGPMFNIKKEVEALQGVDLQTELGGPAEPHPQMMMDAARIYISQFTKVDENFNIKRTGPWEDTSQNVPTSGIVLKADKLRFFSRGDIKIVTAAPEEQSFLSTGAPIQRRSGIHLMHSNGTTGEMQPIPLGNNLKEALSGMIEATSELMDIVMELTNSQIKFNGILGTHHHQSPVFGVPTTPSGLAIPAMVMTLTDQMSRVVMGLAMHKYNLMTLEVNYLEAGGNNYINSEFNKTN